MTSQLFIPAPFQKYLPILDMDVDYSQFQDYYSSYTLVSSSQGYSYPDLEAEIKNRGLSDAIITKNRDALKIYGNTMIATDIGDDEVSIIYIWKE